MTAEKFVAASQLVWACIQRVQLRQSADDYLWVPYDTDGEPVRCRFALPSNPQGLEPLLELWAGEMVNDCFLV